jgi:hypothetical protein
MTEARVPFQLAPRASVPAHYRPVSSQGEGIHSDTAIKPNLKLILMRIYVIMLGLPAMTVVYIE